jgi:hypothetical protein
MNNIVQSKEEAFGRQKQYCITHPDNLVFVDKIGDNTSQRNDGNAGGKNFILDKDKNALKSLLTMTVTSPCLDSSL